MMPVEDGVGKKKKARGKIKKVGWCEAASVVGNPRSLTGIAVPRTGLMATRCLGFRELGRGTACGVLGGEQAAVHWLTTA